MARVIVGQADIQVAMTIYDHVSLDEKRSAFGKLGMRSAEAVVVSVVVKTPGP